mmetsp:Transcript_107322/g.308832  ORF Transcript_107322/g.308832 Transcript_107322/m.308832 type:complete len:142 (-) Transcript_107322:233-658(-)
MAHFVPPGPQNDGSLAYRLEDYLLSGSFLSQLNSFVAKHAHKFEDLADSDDEHRHEWHDIFLEYERMLNDRVEAFLKAEGVTAEQAVEACRRAKAEGKEDYQYFEYLAASVDYQRFHRVMLEFKHHERDVPQIWQLYVRSD